MGLKDELRGLAAAHDAKCEGVAAEKLSALALAAIERELTKIANGVADILYDAMVAALREEASEGKRRIRCTRYLCVGMNNLSFFDGKSLVCGFGIFKRDFSFSPVPFDTAHYALSATLREEERRAVVLSAGGEWEGLRITKRPLFLHSPFPRFFKVMGVEFEVGGHYIFAKELERYGKFLGLVEKRLKEKAGKEIVCSVGVDVNKDSDGDRTHYLSVTGSCRL